MRNFKLNNAFTLGVTNHGGRTFIQALFGQREDIAELIQVGNTLQVKVLESNHPEASLSLTNKAIATVKFKNELELCGIESVEIIEKNSDEFLEIIKSSEWCSVLNELIAEMKEMEDNLKSKTKTKNKSN